MDLQVDQDLGFERREWIAERIGWTAIAAVIVAALLGLFGHGVVSWTSASAAGGAVRVSYERFSRLGGRTAVEVAMESELARGGRFQILVARSYLSDVLLERVTPEPDRTEVRPDGVLYTFVQGDRVAPLVVSFRITPTTIGPASARFGPPDAAVRFTQFFYP